jgi:hypothetical protein
MSAPRLFGKVANARNDLGTSRGIANNHLPKRPCRDLPTQDEELPCRLFRGAEEGRRFSFQHPLPGG